MTLVNINYKGEIVKGFETLEFPNMVPCQVVMKTVDKSTLIVFKSGKCRLMGCKQPITSTNVSIGGVKMHINSIQSATVVLNMKRQYRLDVLSTKIKMIYEPELFPAARLVEYNPLCVNLFASGKVVITGLKSLDFQNEIMTIYYRLINL